MAGSRSSTLILAFSFFVSSQTVIQNSTLGQQDGSDPKAPKPVADLSNEPEKAQESAVSYTVAVLPFEASGERLKDIGSEVSDLIKTFLSTQPGVSTVERAEIEKAFGELELGLSGAVSSETAVKIGHITGAKILVTGRVFVIQNELNFVAKIIGTETTQVFGEIERISIRDSHAEASRKLAEKVAKTIVTKGEELVARVKAVEDPLEDLKALVEGKTLPAVSVTIDERHVNRQALDPAAETEISLMLQKVGFSLVDRATTTQQPRFEVTGEAFSEFALRKGNLVSCKGRVEVKVLERLTGRIIAIDRQSESAVDIAEQTAGKAAIQKASRQIGERIIYKMIKALEE